MSGAVREMYAYGGSGRSCYVCGELGHVARDCCRRAVVGGSGPFCCFVCGKPGHMARYCHKRAGPKCSSGGGRPRAVDREHLTPSSDQTSVGVTREPESLAPSTSHRAGAIAIAIGTSYSSSSDDDEEEEKRVVVESTSNGVFSSGSIRSCRLLGLAAFEMSTVDYDDDDDEDWDGVVSKKSTGSLNATVRREEEKDDDDNDDDATVRREEEKDDDDEEEYWDGVSKKSPGSLNATVRREEEKDDDDDDDCIILDYDPFHPPTVDYQNKFSRTDCYLSVLRNKDISVVAKQGQLALSSGDPIRKEISSLFINEEDDDNDDYDDDHDDDYDDDDEEEVVGKKSTGFFNAEVRVKEEKMREEDWEDDDSCIILDFDPFQPPTADFENKLSLSDHHPSGLQNEDIFIISERGQVACRDYPHSRHHCAKYPFSKSDHESCCPQCYCYVCDVVAPCERWKGSNGHCHASNDDSTWMAHRMLHRLDDIFG